MVMTFGLANAPLLPCDATYALGGFIWLGVVLVAGLWAGQAGRTYVRLYRDRHDVDLPLPEERPDAYAERPWQILSDATRLARIRDEPQSDPELERARRRSINRSGIAIALIVLGLIIMITLNALVGC